MTLPGLCPRMICLRSWRWGISPSLIRLSIFGRRTRLRLILLQYVMCYRRMCNAIGTNYPYFFFFFFLDYLVNVCVDRFLDYYRNIGAVLYPVLSDIAQVEQNVQQLLRNRAASGGGYHPDDNGLVKPFGMSLGFLSLLFAILASGCQLSDLSASERELTSWVYGLCPVFRLVLNES